MEIWQVVLSIAAGIVTVLTALDKLGLIGSFKKLDKDYKDMRNASSTMAVNSTRIDELETLCGIQTKALIVLLRNELYNCFAENRLIAVWTDRMFQEQAAMHDAYISLGGNGEEEILWDKKKKWKILPEEIYVQRKNGIDSEK